MQPQPPTGFSIAALRKPCPVQGPLAFLMSFSCLAFKLHRGVVIDCNTSCEQVGLGGESNERLQVGLPDRLCSAVQMLGMTALCKSTADQCVACAANPSWATLVPIPPWHSRSLVPSQANSETFPPRSVDNLPEPICLALLQRGHHQRWDQPGVIIERMSSSLHIIIHALAN